MSYLDCITTSGRKAGAPCIFPYKFRTKTCAGPKCCNIDKDSKGSWCATKLDEDGNLVTNHFGYCAGTSCEPGKCGI